jgi:hypothetical protein
LAFSALLFVAPADSQNLVSDRFTVLHDALNLRREQEQAWQYFKRATEPSLGEDEHRQAYEKMDALHAPERMDLSIQLMRSDLDRLERRAAAMKAFYAVLSSSQKEIFDRITLPPSR